MRKTPRLLHTPVEPFRVDPDLTADQILERMEHMSFQGRALATAHRVWQRMLADDVTIFMGVAGALSAGGLRMVLAYLVEHRFVDCLVSTGANLYHDLHETRGRRHYVGSAVAHDAALQAEGIDRVYDTYVREEEFVDNDAWIAEFAAGLEPRPFTSREFLYRLGGHLWDQTRGDGLLTAAYRARVPIFCPAIADSSLGLGLSQARHKHAGAGQIDVIGDIVESANLVIRRPRTASIVLGGGTPKNFINQATVQAEFFNPRVSGHQHALQIITDVPYFGGSSGATLEEAQSWGKVAGDASHVTVHADVTIALPLLATALARSAPQTAATRQRPAFDPGQRVMQMDGVPVRGDMFEAPR
jgi:deoxyhypusine synthase